MSLPLSYLGIAGAEEDDNTRIRGVRIACKGEVKELDVPKFQSATVPGYDEIFQKEYNVSSLSRFLGIPIAVRRIPIDDFGELDLTNEEASSLFRICDLSVAETIAGASPTNALPSTTAVYRSASNRSTTTVSGTDRGGSRGASSRGTSSRGGRGGSSRMDSVPPPVWDTRPPDFPIFNGFGGIPDEWEPKTIGPVLLVRLDRKPLHPLHGAAITAYCTHILRRPFADLIESEQRRAWRHGLVMAGTGVTDKTTAASTWAGEIDVFERRRRVLGLASQARFAQFFEEYKTKRVDGRPDLQTEDERQLDPVQKMERWSMQLEEIEAKPEWRDVPSPYDI